MAKSLYNTIQEENPTPWTEEEITRCKDKEVFISRHITHLIDTDFGRDPKWKTLSPMFPGPLSAHPSAHSVVSVQDQRPIEQSQHPELLQFQRSPLQYSPVPQPPLSQQPSQQNQGQRFEHSAHQLSQQQFPSLRITNLFQQRVKDFSQRPPRFFHHQKCNQRSYFSSLLASLFGTPAGKSTLCNLSSFFPQSQVNKFNPPSNLLIAEPHLSASQTHTLARKNPYLCQLY